MSEYGHLPSRSGHSRDLSGLETLCHRCSTSRQKQVHTYLLVLFIFYISTRTKLEFVFLIISVFLCRMIRITAADQLFNIVTKCSINTSSFLAFIALLFSAVEVRTGRADW